MWFGSSFSIYILFICFINILNKKLKEKQKEITEVNKIVTANVSKNASIKKANTKEILSGSAIGFGILLLLGGIFKR